MSKETFTVTDYSFLLDLYIPFQYQFPHLDEISSDFFFNLAKLMQFDVKDIEKMDTFSERVELYIKLVDEGGNGALAILTIPLAKQLRRVNLRFPHLGISAARLLFEVLNSLEKQPETFEDFAVKSGVKV
jgi:hypothetical protein